MTAFWSLLIVTNKMQRNAVFFIVVKALHVSGGFPAPHQELVAATDSYASSSSN
jgi:hypothetical protein